VKQVEISTEQVEPPDWLPDLQQITEMTCRELGLLEYDIRVLLCGDDYIAGLNSQYREQDGPTDILTFVDDPPSVDNGISGDIAISVESVAAAAFENGIEPAAEGCRVYIHGLLHLAGYTHDGVKLGSQAALTNEMLVTQERLVSRLQKETRT
jgi:probable rRNA maturation factor